ncbi:MAG TPA: hypothetical protein VF533_00275 [Solirubrobacteraceae bacterium]|jgi:hypothetical protein
MFVARVICSDTDCADERVVEAATLAELEALMCDCGCVLHIIGWPDWLEPRPSAVVALPARRPPLRDAA